MIKIIACRIFDWILQPFEQQFDMVYIDMKQHEYPQVLKAIIQKEIDESQHYEVLYIMFGLCGNALLGLQARNVGLYVFNAHDCGQILLDDNIDYAHLMAEHPSFSYRTFRHLIEDKASYYHQNKDVWVEAYGEEHGRYLYEMLKDKGPTIYLDFHQALDVEAKQYYQKGMGIEAVYEGSMSAIHAMIMNQEHPKVCYIPPNAIIQCDYGYTSVLHYAYNEGEEHA